MGCMLIFFPFQGNLKKTRQNDNAQMMMAVMSCQVTPLGLKLGLFISNMAAEAIMPITTGRSPMKIPFMMALSLCLDMKWLL